MDTARRLSPHELATYDEQGFVIAPDVIPVAECAAITAEIFGPGATTEAIVTFLEENLE